MYQHALPNADKFFASGHNVPIKAAANGSTGINGYFGTEGPEATETDSSGTGGMRKSLEGKGTAPNDAIHLQRRVGLLSGVALIVGTMIGSGIFVSPSGLLVRTGSVGVSFIIWLACGLLSLLGNQQKLLYIQNSKSSINSTWQSFLAKRNINLSAKWKLFQAVCRAVQTYGGQVWGFGVFEEVDKLQRYFLKRILKLPSSTPNYALSLETGAEDGHYYTLDLHLRYVAKTMFEYSERRLPHQLAKILLRKKLFWVKEVNNLERSFGLFWDERDFAHSAFMQKSSDLLLQLKSEGIRENQRRASESSTRIYKYLDHSRGQCYITNDFELSKITWIFKARCDLILLNVNRFVENETSLCTVCNLREEENIQHFLGRCPGLREFRLNCFGSVSLTEVEVFNILNGESSTDFDRLTCYITLALPYRNELIREFNQ